MKRAFLVLPLATVTVLLVLPRSVRSQASRPQDGELKCYWGTLHAHCSLSGDFVPSVPRPVLRNLLQSSFDDGLKPPTPGSPWVHGPTGAWMHAASRAKIDFLALTDHIRPTANPDGDVTMPERGYDLLREAAAKINGSPAFREKFLAIPGMEWNNSDQGNHINLFFARRAVPSTIPTGDFRRLRSAYLQHPDFERGNSLLITQMNHPRRFVSDYGRAQFQGADANRQFLAEFGPIYSGIEHINNSNGGNENGEEKNAHRNGDQLEPDYRLYLNAGFRVAPVGDHDNHRANWGRHTAARTGVWARSLTPEGFAEAYRARRVFATEDNELAILFRCGPAFMGENAGVPAPDANRRTFTVRIDQMADTDTDQALNEGPYRVELIGDEDGPGGQEARPVAIFDAEGERPSIDVAQGQTASFVRPVRPGAYYYLHVTELGNRDAAEPADAWTAPIWFGPPTLSPQPLVRTTVPRPVPQPSALALSGRGIVRGCDCR